MLLPSFVLISYFEVMIDTYFHPNIISIIKYKIQKPRFIIYVSKRIISYIDFSYLVMLKITEAYLYDYLTIINRIYRCKFDSVQQHQ